MDYLEMRGVIEIKRKCWNCHSEWELTDVLGELWDDGSMSDFVRWRRSSFGDLSPISEFEYDILKLLSKSVT
jgi:hypothetical protein